MDDLLVHQQLQPADCASLCLQQAVGEARVLQSLLKKLLMLPSDWDHHVALTVVAVSLATLFPYEHVLAA